ncbi:phage protein NinX family protein [Serratia marcescens]|uniref:phage protein NinX family protein n=1 Tax=Serratia marcescens TaxID=615 RepID=UPI000F8D9736|nr:phage protein NinX family protein [Serratia marcescens]
MTDYSKMSDFEINKAVAEQLYKDKPSLIVQRDVPSRPAVTVFCDIGDGEIVSILCADYCNNPADAWPIITENNISLIFDNPSSVMATSNCVGWYSDEEPPIHSSSNNPLRAAMIVFLMMKDAEKC